MPLSLSISSSFHPSNYLSPTIYIFTYLRLSLSVFSSLLTLYVSLSTSSSISLHSLPLSTLPSLFISLFYSPPSLYIEPYLSSSPSISTPPSLSQLHLHLFFSPYFSIFLHLALIYLFISPPIPLSQTHTPSICENPLATNLALNFSTHSLHTLSYRAT